MISEMCSERRPPKITIPLHYLDEDVFISQTLRDAASMLSDNLKSNEYNLGYNEGLNKAMDILTEVESNIAALTNDMNSVFQKALTNDFNSVVQKRLEEITKARK
jgi:hypothetical protein